MRILILLYILSANTAFAEIEKIAIPTDTGLKAYWQPKLSEIQGWKHNREASLHYGANFQLPIGQTLNGSETVIYARAFYKPRIPKTNSLQELIDKDIAEFKARDPNMIIDELTEQFAKNRTKFKVFKLTPNTGKNWEVISFADEGEFYLMFVVSSRSEVGLSNSMSDYFAFVNNYQ